MRTGKVTGHEPSIRAGNYDLLTPEAVARAQRDADRLLEQVGLEIRDHPVARERLEAAGARVVGERVHFEPGLARAIVQEHAPRGFVQRARNASHDIAFGGNGTFTAPAAGPPMVRGRDGRRRYGTLRDHDDFARLTQRFGSIDHAGGMYCEIMDHGTAVRHLYGLSRTLQLTDKAVMGPARTPGQVRDCLDMIRVVFGSDRVDRECCLLSLFNLEPPLVLQGETVEGMRLTAEANQACLVTSYTVLGMNAPVTTGTTLALMLAEIEAGIALVQLFRPGTPVIAGIYGVPFSMSAMRPAFGSIESMMLMCAGAQLVRTLGCPVRGDGAVTSAKLPDAQAGRDTGFGLTCAHVAGVDFALQSAGWLEGGLVTSLDKFRLDAAGIASVRAMQYAGEEGVPTESPNESGTMSLKELSSLLDACEDPPMDDSTRDALERFVAEKRAAAGHEIDDSSG